VDLSEENHGLTSTKRGKKEWNGSGGYAAGL